MMLRHKLLLAFTLLSVIHVMAIERYYDKAYTLNAGEIVRYTIESGSIAWNYHCRVELPKTVRNPKWSFMLGAGSEFEYVINVERQGRSIDDNDYVCPVLVNLINGRGEELASYRLEQGLDVNSDALSLILDKASGADSISCMIGQRQPLVTFGMSGASEVKVVSLEAKTEIGLLRLSLFCETSDLKMVSDIDSVETLTEYIDRSNKQNENVWRYLDRDTDPRLLNLGGDYKIATIADDNGGYDIIYLGGARVNASYWKPMMVKGKLEPTAFVNHYNLVWLDAWGRRVDTETSADIENSSILKLNFPLQGGTIRFAVDAKIARHLTP